MNWPFSVYFQKAFFPIQRRHLPPQRLNQFPKYTEDQARHVSGSIRFHLHRLGCDPAKQEQL